MKSNPFIWNTPLLPEKNIPTMVWREKQLNKLLEDVAAAKHPLIVGPRLSGRTTLAYQLAYKLRRIPGNNNIVFFVNLSTLVSPAENELISYISDTIIKELLSDAERLGLKVNYEMLEKNFTKNIPYRFNELTQFLNKLVDCFTGISRIALIIDGIEELSEDMIAKTLNVFRSIATGQIKIKNCNPGKPYYSFIVLCQQNLTEFNPHPDKGGSPYNEGTETRRLRDFDFKELEELMKGEHEGEKLSDIFEKDAVKFLFYITGGHAHLIQRLCHRAIDVLIENGQQGIDTESIIEALFWLFKEGVRDLRAITAYEQYEKSEKIIVDLLRGIPVPFERCLKKISYLEDRGIIKEDEKTSKCIFRTKIYEMLFLKLYFNKIFDSSGVSLEGDKVLYLDIPEIQRVLVSDKVLRYLKQKILEDGVVSKSSIHEYLTEAFEKLFSFNIDIIKYYLGKWSENLDINNISNADVIDILAEAFYSYFESNLKHNEP